MVQTPPKTIALEAFLALPETKPASEFIDGKIIQKPMPQGQHSRLQQKLVASINAVTEDDRIALALPELRCTFGERSIVPDVAVFVWDRIPVNPDGTIADRFNAPPDWVIEILSPEQSDIRLIDKLLHCLHHGAQLGWLVDAKEKLVLACTRDRQIEIFENPSDRLPVPEFLPSLHLTPERLWGWLQVR